MHAGPPGLATRPCYRWEGVPPGQQFSRIPEPEEEAEVRCFKSFLDDAPEVPCRCAQRGTDCWCRWRQPAGSGVCCPGWLQPLPM